MSRATVDLQGVRFFLGYGLIFFFQNVLTVGVSDGRALLRRVAAGADRARDHAAARRARLPLQPHRTPDAPRRAAEARRRRHGRGGEHRRRPRRQGVRAGARGGGEVRAALRARLRADAAGEPPARDLRAADRVRAAARPGGGAPPRRADGRGRLTHARQLRRLQSLSRHARPAPAGARHVDRPGTARHRGGRAHLRDHGRAGGDRRPPGAATCRRARVRSASRTSLRVPAPGGPCSTGSTSRSRPAGRSR